MGIGFERIYLFLKTSQTTSRLVETESLSIAFIFRVTQLLFCFFFPLLSSHLLCDDTSTQDWFVFT